MTVKSYFDDVLSQRRGENGPPTRQALLDLLKGQDIETPDPELEVSEIQEFEHYHREKWTFTTRPGLRATGWFLRNKISPQPLPAILCLPGHGRGVDGIVGMDEKGEMRPWKAWGEYHNDFALQCVANGYHAFALEHLSFGRRQSPNSPPEWSCTPDTLKLLAYNLTLVGLRVWDARKVLDLLSARPDVRSDKLAVMGISGGGTVGFFTAAADERVGMACISGYFNKFAHSVLDVYHCPDNVLPGMALLGDMPDFAALIAPRRLSVENGTLDPIFPAESFVKAVEEAKPHFASTGGFTSDVFEGEHIFNGRSFWGPLKEWAAE